MRVEINDILEIIMLDCSVTMGDSALFARAAAANQSFGNVNQQTQWQGAAAARFEGSTPGCPRRRRLREIQAQFFNGTWSR